MWHSNRNIPRFVAAVLGLALAATPLPVEAAVSVTVDSFSNDPALQACTSADNEDCSLRGAILAANADTENDYTITLPAGAYTLESQQLILTSNVTLVGAGADVTFIQAEDEPNFAFSRVMQITDAEVTLRGLTLRYGRASSTTISGSAIFAGGVSTVLTLEDLHITENVTVEGSGTVNFGGGELIIRDSTISNNTVSGFGGGLAYAGTQGVLIENTTFSGNSASDGGGAIASALENAGLLTIRNSTITANSSGSGGAGLDILDNPVLVSNSIIAGQMGGLDCVLLGSAALSSEGFNIESDSSCGFDQASDQQNVTTERLNLGVLADNGGEVPTHALRFPSLAIDGGSCPLAGTADARGIPRSDEDDAIFPNAVGGNGCDIGAYEYVPDGSETQPPEPEPLSVSNPGFESAVGDEWTAIQDSAGDLRFGPTPLAFAGSYVWLFNSPQTGIEGLVQRISTSGVPGDVYQLSVQHGRRDVPDGSLAGIRIELLGSGLVADLNQCTASISGSADWNLLSCQVTASTVHDQIAIYAGWRPAADDGLFGIDSVTLEQIGP
ncbi:MAG: hypothetical protein GYB68_06000 [Chloroflexi bacterium]|nr:hypothetical protein [Chloroflexota bacterium]